MLVLRKSDKEREYHEGWDYRCSHYNVCDATGHVTYNVASGAVVDGWSDCNVEDLPLEDVVVLVKNGLLVPTDCDELADIISKLNIEPKGNINYFTIIPTTACNAKCFYCYEEGYCKQTMTGTQINKLVDYICDQIEFEKSFTLDWYGGEPLLCVETIDDIILKLSLKGAFDNREWSSSITTNATLFDDELIDHAICNWKLSVAHITIDGTELQHNARKNVSFNGDSAFRATLDAIYKLLKNGVYVNLRVHLDRNNKNSFNEILDDIAQFFEFNNFHLFPTFLFPPEFEMPDNYIPDDEKEGLFFDVFNAMFEKKMVSNLVDLFPRSKKHGCFATDAHSAVIAPNGSLHACVQEFSSAKDWDEDNKFVNYIDVPCDCAQCKFFPICLGGCVHNRLLDGTVRTPCVRNRYIIKPLLELVNMYRGI